MKCFPFTIKIERVRKTTNDVEIAPKVDELTPEATITPTIKASDLVDNGHISFGQHKNYFRLLTNFDLEFVAHENLISNEAGKCCPDLIFKNKEGFYYAIEIKHVTTAKAVQKVRKQVRHNFPVIKQEFGNVAYIGIVASNKTEKFVEFLTTVNTIESRIIENLLTTLVG